MDKILVTGAAGYIGSHVVSALLDMGYEVTATDMNIEHIDKRAARCCCDIFSETDPFHQLGEPDILIHMAWRDGFVHNAPSHFIDLPRHYDFLKRMVESGVRSVSVMGSMHEIGYYEGAVEEDTPQNPSSLYGISKNALRQALFALNKATSFDLHWLRGFYVCGDDRRNHSVFAKILQKAEEGEKAFPFTTGTNQYDFIQVADLGLEIALAAVQSQVCGVINCCSGHPVALKDKAEEFIAKHGLDIKLAYGVYPDRPYDSKIIYGNNEKIKQILKAYIATHNNATARKAAVLLSTLA